MLSILSSLSLYRRTWREYTLTHATLAHVYSKLVALVTNMSLNGVRSEWIERWTFVIQEPHHTATAHYRSCDKRFCLFRVTNSIVKYVCSTLSFIFGRLLPIHFHLVIVILTQQKIAVTILLRLLPGIHISVTYLQPHTISISHFNTEFFGLFL